MFTQEQVADACRKYGPSVGPLPAGVDGTKLLWGLSGCESSFGVNCTPRHEPAYDVKGMYSQEEPMPLLLARFGSLAACSYGPLQMLFVNAPSGFVPQDFQDIDKAMEASSQFLSRLLRRYEPQTLEEIGSVWNCGHVQQPLSSGVQRYANQLKLFYEHPMPV